MATRPLDPALDATVAPQAADGHAGTMAQGSQPGGAGGPSAGLRPGIVVAETYEITRLLGQGGMGAVWEAKHLRLPGKRVVVKVLLFGATDAIGAGALPARGGDRLAPRPPEHRPGAGLQHAARRHALHRPRAAPGRVAGVAPAARAAAARTGDGDRHARSARRWPPRTAKGSSTAICKPDNVFLCPTDLGGEVRDVVKVLDFGISKIRGSKTVLTQDAALLGTPQYMAPEQATGRNDEIDARTDVFAFGAMTFEMLAGQRAVHGRHAGGGHPRDRLHPHPAARRRRPRTCRPRSSRRSSARWTRTATRVSPTSTASSRR